jgi:hypothetical protein
MMQTPLTAIVHTADGAVLIGSAQCPEHLAAQIAAYVRQRCDHALQPKVAEQVRSLLRKQLFYAAIALYFDRVGECWGEERLELQGLGFSESPTAGTTGPGNARLERLSPTAA